MLLCWQAGGQCASLFQPVQTKCCAICEVVAQCDFIPVSNSLHTLLYQIPSLKKTELHNSRAVGSILRKLWQDVIFFLNIRTEARLWRENHNLWGWNYTTCCKWPNSDFLLTSGTDRNCNISDYAQKKGMNLDIDRSESGFIHIW